ncbi:MAG: GIY-YIG nuclease family protein [Tissierellia bacterium]|nr:GIY-YIG nuclease family protein [Tissierellia bacterium]
MINSKDIFYTYILECADKTYYTGYTIDPKKRILKHNQKKASKYTRSRTPVKFVFLKAFNSKHKAMSFEKKIKLLKRSEKEKIISGLNVDFWN